MPNISLNLRILTLAAMMAVSAANAQDLKPSLVASRTIGTAPLFVHFDATATTSKNVPDPFRQVLYTFDYGDSAAGNWVTTGKARGLKAGGPIGAFVFERPGTYTVRMVANDGRHSDERRITITVLDPDVVYAGEATVCIATDSSTGWGPAGAAYVNAIPDKSTWNGKRLIFKRGQDFSASSDVVITRGAANFQLCASSGAGAKPILPVVSIGGDRPPAGTDPWPDNITLVDLNFTRGYRIGAYGQHHLALRCDMPAAQELNFGWSIYAMFDDQYQFVPIDQWPVPKYHAMAECTMPGDQSTATYNLFSDACSHAAILGCTMSQAVYHNLRLCQAYKTLLADNVTEGRSPNSDYHCIKVHGGSLAPYAEPLTSGSKFWATRYVVAQDNLIGSAGCLYAWLAAFSPQNSSVTEGVQDILVLGNTFIRSGAGQVDVVMGGSRITTLDNTTQGGSFTTAVGHDEALPAGWKGPYYTSRA